LSFRRLSTLLLLLAAVAVAQTPSAADDALQRGLAFARDHNFDQARQVFLNAQHNFSADARFPVELAGLAFQQKRNAEAIHYLHRALKLDPNDEYANNFLASLYLLEGNLDAALKYWNRIAKPQINQIYFEPEPKNSLVLLDRALTISPRSQLPLHDLKTSEARLESFEILSSPQYTLHARPDGEFDILIRAVERNGVGNSKPQALIRLFRGLPYQTVYPEYYNVAGSGTNITSLLRWDSDKRRATLQVSGPLQNRPSFHYHLFADARDENWLLSPNTTNAFSFHSRQYVIGAALNQVVSGKWNWGLSTSLTHEGAPQLSAPDVFSDGYSLQYRARVERQLLYVPEHRLTLTASGTPSLGRNFSSSASTFARMIGATELTWLPGHRLGDNDLSIRLSASRSVGTLPFSELAMLGVERDNDLLLHGHPGTRDGLKGSSPLACTPARHPQLAHRPRRHGQNPCAWSDHRHALLRPQPARPPQRFLRQRATLRSASLEPELFSSRCPSCR
jgi:tetratricopeptide (TPR) repeat protein